ncbi:MAG: TolC family protein [Candidatus Azobacteroides sp.]|nr:TolC family protein [Candidatus Azobacteroides sp.]
MLLVFSLLTAFNGLVHAQEKTIKEELQELREQTRRQSELFNKTQPADSAQSKIQNAGPDFSPDSIGPVIRSTVQQEETNIQRKPIGQPAQWSLESCIQYAIDHNINVKLLQLQQEDAEIQQNTAKNSRLPNLNAAINQEWDFERTEDLLAKLQDNRYDVWNQSTTAANIQSVVPIFTGFRIPNEMARTKLEFQVATQNLEKAKDDLSLNITSLFLQVLFNKELYNINEKQLELSSTQIERTRQLVQSGSVPKSQIYDIEAQVAKDSVAVLNAQNDVDLALLDLAQNLELEEDKNFDIYVPDFTGNVVAMFMGSLQSPDLIYENALNAKPVIKGQEFKVESAKKALKVAEAGYYPQLDLFLGYRTHFQHVYRPRKQLNPADPAGQTTMELNTPISDQLRNYGSEFIGLTLNIPIFNRFQIRNQVRGAKVDILYQQLILDNNKKTLYKEIQTAYKNAVAAREKYRASDKAVLSANESFEYAKRRYELGNATVFEFNEARTRLLTSQLEQAQAKYEYILRAKILDFYNGIPIRL